MSGRTLAKEIFRADSPEEFARELPAQSMYLALQAVGLDSAQELLLVATPRQYRLLLDFDLWSGDQFVESRVWHWLTVLDQERGLEPCEKFFAALDSRLLTLLMKKYVDAVFPDEPTEQPPEPGYYTPDRGNTWVRIRIDDPERLRVFGKLLALLYERTPERYYQMLAESDAATATELEEESYQDKCRRLWDCGIPDPETSFRLNSPLPPERALADTERFPPPQSSSASVTPLAFSIGMPQPLGFALLELCADEASQAAVEAELAFIANAAFVSFQVDYNDSDEVRMLLEKIRGALNLGLERLLAYGADSAAEVCRKPGLQSVYRVGLHELRRLTNAARSFETGDAIQAAIAAAAKRRMPELPKFLRPDGSIELEGSEIPTTRRAAAHLVEIDAASALLG